jgi:TonB family protein
MKLILSFFFLITGFLAFGQSAKKLNVELRSKLNQFKIESDSIWKIVVQRKTNLKVSWNTLEKNELAIITAQGSMQSLLRDNIGFLHDALTRLSDNPQKIVDLQKIKETRIPLEETERVYRAYSYLSPKKINVFTTSIPDTLKLGKYDIKVENELIRNTLNHYTDAKSRNLQSIATLTEYDKEMKVFQIKIEAIYKQSTAAYDLLWNSNTALMKRYSKLNADYLANPKVFPPIYKEVFEKAVMMEYPKQIDSLTIETKSFFSSTPDSDVKKDTYKSAEFPGGSKAMWAYLSENIVMPRKVKEQGITGQCNLKLIVLESGEISDIQVTKGIPDCPECDAEAIRVVKSMPNWVPAHINDKAIKGSFYLPVQFE